MSSGARPARSAGLPPAAAVVVADALAFGAADATEAPPPALPLPFIIFVSAAGAALLQATRLCGERRRETRRPPCWRWARDEMVENFLKKKPVLGLFSGTRSREKRKCGREMSLSSFDKRLIPFRASALLFSFSLRPCSHRQSRVHFATAAALGESMACESSTKRERKRRERRERERKNTRGASRERAKGIGSLSLSFHLTSLSPSIVSPVHSTADAWTRDFERAEQLATDVANAIQVRERARDRENFFLSSSSTLPFFRPSPFSPSLTSSPPFAATTRRNGTPATRTAGPEPPASRPTPGGAWGRSARPSTASGPRQRTRRRRAAPPPPTLSSSRKSPRPRGTAAWTPSPRSRRGGRPCCCS